MLNKIREEFGFSSIDDNNTASKLMNDEIKEILAYFDEYVKITDMHDSEPMLNWKDLKIVLDYITNLQQENQELNDSITWWTNRFNAAQRDYEDYKSRIEKAVDYMKKHIEKCNIDGYKGKFDNFDIFTKPQELLNILNGRSDK